MKWKDVFKSVLEQSGCSLAPAVDEAGEEAEVWSKSSTDNCQQIVDDLFNACNSTGEMV